MDPSVAQWMATTFATVVRRELIRSWTTPSGVDRMVRALRKSTGMRPGRRYRDWLREPETWDDLTVPGQESYDRMVSRLVDHQRFGLFGLRKSNPERAHALVSATIAHLLSELPPSTAVAVADARAERRFHEVLDRLDTDATFEDKLQLLPPAVQPLLLEISDPRVRARLVDAVISDEPQRLIRMWSRERPDWLVLAPAVVIHALAEIAHAYGLAQEASDLFEEAGDLGRKPGESYIRAAFEALRAGNLARRDALLTKACTTEDSAGTGFFASVLTQDWDGALQKIERDSALGDGLTGLAYSFALETISGDDEAIAFTRVLAATHATSPGVVLRLADLLVRRAQRPKTTSREGDLREALELAVSARDMRRRWRGNSAEAVEVACRAAALLRDYTRVIELAASPPHGQAKPEEASLPEVQFSTAQAAMMTGNDELVEQVAASSGPFIRILLHAERLSRDGQPQEALAPVYEEAWSHARQDNERVTLWLSASSSGIEDLPGADELASRSDDVPLLCKGVFLVAQGNFSEAIRLLRPHRASEALRELLVDAYLGTGDVDAAVEELLEMAKGFSNTAHDIRAVTVLLGADRKEDATQIADRALVESHITRPERNLLHEVGVANAHDQNAWGEMERRVRAWITESGVDRRRRWLLTIAAYNQGEPERAWRILNEGGTGMSPESPVEAELWIALFTRFRPTAETFSALLELIDEFPDAPDVKIRGTNAFLLRSEPTAEVDDEELRRWQELIQQRAETPAPDDTFISIHVPDDAEGIVEALRPHLEQRARTVDSALRRVEKDHWPYGTLSSATGHPYTTVLVERPTGYFPLASHSTETVAGEVDAASAALQSGRVIADISAVVVGSFLAELWPRLFGSFRMVATTAASRVDVAAAVDQTTPQPAGTLAWDLRSGRPVMHEFDEGSHEAIRARISSVHTELSALTTHPTSTGSQGFIGPPWLECVQVARDSGLPLWADDVALRALARAEGVTTFGTDSLILALAQMGDLTDEETSSAFEALRAERCVDLPLDPEWVVRRARQDEWGPGPAALVISRPSTWSEPIPAFQLWSKLATEAAGHDITKLAVWVHAASTALAAFPTDHARVTELMGGLVARAATLTDFDADTFAACVHVASTAATEHGRPDPTRRALEVLFDLLTQEIGTAAAATILSRLGALLGPEHLSQLRSILFETPGD